MKNEAKRADEGSHELGQQTIREQVEFWDRSRLVFCKDTEDIGKGSAMPKEQKEIEEGRERTSDSRDGYGRSLKRRGEGD